MNRREALRNGGRALAAASGLMLTGRRAQAMDVETCGPLVEFVGVEGNLGKGVNVREYVVRHTAPTLGSDFVWHNTPKHLADTAAGQIVLGTGAADGITVGAKIEEDWCVLYFRLDNFRIDTGHEAGPSGGTYHGQGVITKSFCGRRIRLYEMWCEPEGFEVSALGRREPFGSARTRWVGNTLKFMGPALYQLPTWDNRMIHIFFNVIEPTSNGFIWHPIRFETPGTDMCFTIGKVRLGFADGTFNPAPVCG